MQSQGKFQQCGRARPLEALPRAGGKHVTTGDGGVLYGPTHFRQRCDWLALKGARRQTHFPAALASPSCGRAHARASRACACASPPFGRTPLCRASRSSLGQRARPPADIRLPGRRRGLAVRSRTGRKGRSPGKLRVSTEEGLHPDRSCPA